MIRKIDQARGGLVDLGGKASHISDDVLQLTVELVQRPDQIADFIIFTAVDVMGQIPF